MTPQVFIEHLRAENEAFYRDDRGRGALKDLQVVFPLPWIYLAELVQNAIDAKATRLRFAIGPEDSLVFEHNGNRFRAKDVRALCTRGVSTKSTNTVGFMGVGFKSVFKTYETVLVSSGRWRFRLCVPSDEVFGVRQWIGAVLPIWASDAPPPREGYTCRFELSRRVVEGTCSDDLAELLREGYALLSLLAWNRVSEMEVDGHAWKFTLTEVPINGGDASRVKVAASSRDGTTRTWLLFVKSYQPSEAAVIRFLRHRQIQPAPEEREEVLAKASRLRDVILFCELAQDTAPLPVNRGQCFSLVPTGHTTCLGLHMQAEWLLDISRREPMRILGDPWQEEILAQVPYLLKAYLEWLVSPETDGAGSWPRGYAALPGPTEDTEIDAALRAGKVADELCALLADCEFVPHEVSDNRVDFTSPAATRVLPDPLQRCIEGEHGPKAELFGPTIAALATLGTRATDFLRKTGLLSRLAPGELQAQWADGKVGEWFNGLGEAATPAYVRLIGSLAELETDPAWAAADLRCLPAADGEWRTRTEIGRYPPNWGILSPSPAVSVALEPFAGTRAELLDWKTDQVLRQDASAQRYIKPLKTLGLENVASAWWASLPIDLVPSDRALVVAFTDLVRRQRTLTTLVPNVLALHVGTERLLPIQQVVLADPYTGSYRRQLFPNEPSVSAAYLTEVPDATDADWRVFFESQEPGPKGRPTLLLEKSHAAPDDVAAAGRQLWLRVTYKEAGWRGVTIDSNTHYLVDSQWPHEAASVLESPTEAGAQALQRWMLEHPGFFRTWPTPSIVYIPYGSGSASSVALRRDSEWLKQLKRLAWLFDQAGHGSYRASDILGAFDPSRPDAPVARLAEGFAALAAELGIAFGTAIPNAPAIDRLRTLGPRSSWDTLKELVDDAIVEAGEDESKGALLRSVLNDTPLFALPDGRQTPDRLSRVGAARLVLRSRRSTLGDWVCSCDDYPEPGVERAVLQQVLSAVTVPEGTAPEQAAAFLQWVWASEPDADKVRQVLPRAFQYALESEEAVASLRSQAKVFVSARRWVRVADGVFLNDLGIADKELIDADEGVLLATPGHLGDDDESRRRTCSLLGLQLASTRYRLEIEKVIGGVLTPETWRSGFRYAHDRFWRELVGADDESAEGIETPPPLELVCVDTITRRLLKDEDEIDVLASNVAIGDTEAYAVGEPLEFAPDLAETLIEHWGITLRRDGYALGSRLTGLLARIDRMPEDEEPREPTKPEPEPITTPAEKALDDTTASPDKQPPEQPTEDQQKPTPTKPSDPTHTRKQKDARHDWLQRKRKDLRLELRNIERQIAEGLSAELEPEDEDDRADDHERRPFGDDEKYRQAAVDYERQHGRFPEVADKGQAGYDMDSYSHDRGHPDRALVRRIEVKGKGGVWKGDEIVELSDRQMKDALARKVQEAERTAADFDYWLYVVETSAGVSNVIPLRNPVRRAAKFEFRGGLWRPEGEAEDPESAL
jgi:hypothetical protein